MYSGVYICTYVSPDPSTRSGRNSDETLLDFDEADRPADAICRGRVHTPMRHRRPGLPPPTPPYTHPTHTLHFPTPPSYAPLTPPTTPPPTHAPTHIASPPPNCKHPINPPEAPLPPTLPVPLGATTLARPPNAGEAPQGGGSTGGGLNPPQSAVRRSMSFTRVRVSHTPCNPPYRELEPPPNLPHPNIPFRLPPPP